ncbi:MAG: DNA integrity scanning protein DisA nucleotide-binding domain protein [Verrucomicrobiota bacterium]
MPSPWIYLLDVVLCAIVLRIILGWLLAYPRLIRLMASLVIVVSFGVLIYFLELQLAGILVLLFLVPVVVILFLSFLPELSRVYQAASRGNLFRPRIFQGEEILSDLAEALIQFKQRHLGCLLVFPGNRDEEGLVSGGEEVDALVNRSLLLSIFDPHCPRHDGAAIIRGNRIVRIGAVLPLASAEGADAHLGTRHLAAIGLSERIDGYVLVVSEERGVLSYAHDGKLKEIKYSDKEELKQILSRILGGEEQEEESVRQQKVLPALLWIMAIILAGFGSWQVKQIKEQFREQYTETRTVYFQEVDASIQ